MRALTTDVLCRGAWPARSDPFKDTAGPSIHVLIKMLATITLVMAPLFLDSAPVQIGKWS